MKEAEITISNYVKNSSENACKKINELKRQCYAQAESKTRWMDIFRNHKIPYYQKMVASLVEIGGLYYFNSYKTGNNVLVDRYKFITNDLMPLDFYNIFISIEKYNKKRVNIKGQVRKNKKTRNRTFSIANHGISVTDSIRLDRLNKLKECSDEELIEEFGRRGLKAWDKLDDKELADRLRERGYEVTAEKVITETIKL